MASNRIKGITIEIGGNTTQLTKALDNVDKSLKDTQSQLKDVNKLLKLDPSNVELLRQKQDLLSKAITDTKSRQEELKKAYEQAKKAGDTEENRKQQDALQRELIETEQRLKSYESEMKDSGKATKEAGESMDKAKDSASTFGDVLKAKLTGDAVVSGVKKLASSLKNLALGSVQLSDELNTQAQVTGLSTDALQEYAYMSELVDVSVDTITGSMTKLTKNMKIASKGSGDVYDAFKKLGVSFTTASGALRDNEDVFNDLIDALGDIDNETERDTLAMTLFGKSAQDLNPLIKTGSKQLKAYAQEAHDVGYVMSNDVIKRNVEASDALERMKNSVTAAKNELGSALAPAIKTAADKLSDLVKWGKNNTDTLKKLGTVVSTVVGTFVAAKAAVAAIELPTKAAAAAQALLNGAMAANPIALVTAALAGLFVALDRFSKKSYDVGADVKALSSKIDTLSEEIDENVSEWNAVTNAQDKNIQSINSEYAHYEDLANELSTIVDKNGKVKKGYEDRAQVITGLLADALGVEIKLVGNQIQNYKDLEQKIKDVLVQKKAELVLKAQEEAYASALQTRTQASLDLVKADEARIAANQKASQKSAELSKLEAEKASLAKWGYSDYTAEYMKDLDARIEAKKKEVSELTSDQKKADDAYAKAKQTVEDTTYTIKQYESNLAYAHKGEFDKINSVNAETARSYASLSDKQKKELDKMTNNASKAASKMYKSGQSISDDFVDGLIAGLGTSAEQKVSAKTKRLAVKMKQTMQDNLDINSPSKFTKKLGQYFVEGLEVGLDDEESSALSKIAAFGQAVKSGFQNATAGGLQMSGMAGYVQSTNPETSAGASAMINGISGGTTIGDVNVAVTVNGNVDNYDEMAAVIGQKLQQQMARQGRAFA